MRPTRNELIASELSCYAFGVSVSDLTIHSGEHDGRKVGELSDGELSGLCSSWNGLGRFRQHDKRYEFSKLLRLALDERRARQ